MSKEVKIEWVGEGRVIPGIAQVTVGDKLKLPEAMANQFVSSGLAKIPSSPKKGDQS